MENFCHINQPINIYNTTKNKFVKVDILKKNTSVGELSLKNNSGKGNSSFGFSSLKNNLKPLINDLSYPTDQFLKLSNNNTSIGDFSMYANTTGYDNVALGKDSLRSNTSGLANVSIGYNSCGNNTTGVENTGIGQGSLPNNTTGNFNTSLGSLSLYWPKFSSSNTGCGYSSGAYLYDYSSEGSSSRLCSDNTFIGAFTGPALEIEGPKEDTIATKNPPPHDASPVTPYPQKTYQNVTCIGYGATPTLACHNNNYFVSNEITLGNSDVTKLICATSHISSPLDDTQLEDIEPLINCCESLKLLKCISASSNTCNSATFSGMAIMELITSNVNNILLDDLVEYTNCKMHIKETSLIPYLVCAIQELCSKVEHIEQKLTELTELTG